MPKPIHDDPADQIIMATARDLEALLVTKDELMHSYPYIKTLW
jgi:PIN domain nuclease of toxin-antitoxin system